MKALGIRYQMLMITLIPVLLIDVFFTWNYIDQSIAQADELLRSKGEVIGRQLAGASEFNLYTGNDAQIRYLLDQVVGKDEIVRAAVYDRAGTLIAETIAGNYRADLAADYLYLRQAILSLSIEHTDVFSPDLDETRQTSTLGWVHLYLSLEQLQQASREIVTDGITFFVVVLIMALALTATISRRITGPIYGLIEHLKDVETGQLGKTIEPVEGNEIGALQQGFNRMTQALATNRQYLNQRIQQATQQLNEAISDLETKNRELGYARDEAQNANRSKSEFLANMSHEIRTPINGIKGFISLLAQSNLDIAQQRYVEIIQKSIGDLTNIVNEILDFSKMESGKLHIVDETFDLYEVVEQTRDILFISVLAKGIDLNLVIYSDTPRRVVGDKLRLKQILLNLIGNAIKFTDQGRVVVRVSVEDIDAERALVEIRVEDTGIGISAADQQNLFQAFSQAESSDARRFSGTGLGLVISKNLAGLMGGDIEMQSRPGVGSSFTLRLPLPLAADETADTEDASEQARVLIVAGDKTCLMETRSLYDRAGAMTESSLIDARGGTDAAIETLQRNLPYIDLLVLDLRHLAIDLDRALTDDVTGAVRVILMDYDPGAAASHGNDVEFVSIVSTTRTISELIARGRRPPDEAAETVETTDGSRKRVLLVDDNEVNLRLASELIRLWGHDVAEASHGAEAIEIYRRESFDLIVLDIQMPDIDGVSLLQMMREHRPDDDTPMVALTANVLNHEADRLLELGFDYFLGKPIDEDRFRALLDGNPQRRMPAAAGDAEDGDQAVDYARSLKLCADNPATLRTIFGIIRRDIPEQQAQLWAALGAGDRDKLANLAHKLHGVTCYASLPRLRRKVLWLQQQLTRDDERLPESGVEQLVAELGEVKRAVEEFLDDMPGDSNTG